MDPVIAVVALALICFVLGIVIGEPHIVAIFVKLLEGANAIFRQ